jgi:hypothetical protein
MDLLDLFLMVWLPCMLLSVKADITQTKISINLEMNGLHGNQEKETT